MSAIRFESGDLVNGTLQGWPVSFIAEHFPGQGWDLNLAPYSGPDDESCSDEVLTACHEVSDMHHKTKADVRAALVRVGFKPD
jgi:hypothetical protein